MPAIVEAFDRNRLGESRLITTMLTHVAVMLDSVKATAMGVETLDLIARSPLMELRRVSDRRSGCFLSRDTWHSRDGIAMQPRDVENTRIRRIGMSRTSNRVSVSP